MQGLISFGATMRVTNMRNDSTDTVKLVARDAAASVGVRYVIVRSATG